MGPRPLGQATPFFDGQAREATSGSSAVRRMRGRRCCHKGSRVTKANYTTWGSFAYEVCADPVITTLPHASFEGNFGSYIEDLKKRNRPDADSGSEASRNPGTAILAVTVEVDHACVRLGP